VGQISDLPFLALAFSGGFLNLAVADARSAGPHTLAGPINQSPNRLQIDIPAPVRNVVSVAHLVPELRPSAADVANSCHKHQC